MRILIGHQHAYAVERICPTARDGKRTLKEFSVSELYLDYAIGGKENGEDILRWAVKNNVVPHKVVLVCNRLHVRQSMGHVLTQRGYLTMDGINFLRH